MDLAIEAKLNRAWPDLAPLPDPRPFQTTPVRRGAALLSVGSSVPEQVVTNEPIAERLGVSDEWIVERTGVRERRIAAPEKLLHELAAEAGQRALEVAGVEASDLDQILVATMTHEDLTPNAAALVAEKLGADKPGATDVGSACTAFVSALGFGAATIETGRADRILVIGADLMSRITDPDDRATAPVFADGAGAVVLGRVEGESRIGPVILGSDGASSWVLRVSREEALVRMEGPETFIHAVDRLCQATLEVLEQTRRGLDEVDLFVYHQANSRIIAAVGDRLGLPPERVVDCVPRYGNTSAASIPIALAEAQGQGLLTDGSRVLMAAFGGGLTWGATLVDWGAATPAEPA